MIYEEMPAMKTTYAAETLNFCLEDDGWLNIDR